MIPPAFFFVAFGANAVATTVLLIVSFVHESFGIELAVALVAVYVLLGGMVVLYRQKYNCADSSSEDELDALWFHTRLIFGVIFITGFNVLLGSGVL